jgi:hypothetical protein
MFISVIMVTSLAEFLSLFLHVPRHGFVDFGKDGRRWWVWPTGKVAEFACSFVRGHDFIINFLSQCRISLLIPHFILDKMSLEAFDWIASWPTFEFIIWSVSRRVIGGRVTASSVRVDFDVGCTESGCAPVSRPLRDTVQGKEIVAIHSD